MFAVLHSLTQDHAADHLLHHKEGLAEGQVCQGGPGEASRVMSGLKLLSFGIEAVALKLSGCCLAQDAVGPLEGCGNNGRCSIARSGGFITAWSPAQQNVHIIPTVVALRKHQELRSTQESTSQCSMTRCPWTSFRSTGASAGRFTK